MYSVVRAKHPPRLAVVLTQGEVAAVLRHLSDTPWIMATLLYAAGLRLMECLRLRVKDLDFAYNQIVVRHGKGQKDRVTMLPQHVKAALQQYLGDVQRLHTQDLTTGSLPSCITDTRGQSRRRAVISWDTMRNVTPSSWFMRRMAAMMVSFTVGWTPANGSSNRKR